jgi:hypothetical protein
VCEVASGSWLIVANNSFGSTVERTNLTLPFEKISFWQVDIWKSWLKDGVSRCVFGPKSCTSDGGH